MKAETTPSIPTRDYDPAEQRFLERTREKADRLRADRIRDLNADRPRPQLQMDLTPSGSVVREVHTPEADKKNAEIDKEIQTFNKSIVAAKDRAKNDFERSR